MAGDPGARFSDNFVAMADDFGRWLSAPLQVEPFVSFADDAAAVAVTSPQAPGEVGHAAGQAVDAAGNFVNDATKAAGDAAMVAAAWGAVALVGFLLFQRMERT